MKAFDFLKSTIYSCPKCKDNGQVEVKHSTITGLWWVECEVCKCSTTSSKMKSSAIKNWNEAVR